MDHKWEAIIIGTGYGGAISACRLAKRWPGKVLVVERGKRYPADSLPQSSHDMKQNFFHLPKEQTNRPMKIPRDQLMTGILDIRSFQQLDLVTVAGVGGGALMGAKIFVEAPNQSFDSRWPDSCNKSQLEAYYRVVREVLGVRAILGPNGEDFCTNPLELATVSYEEHSVDRSYLHAAELRYGAQLITENKVVKIIPLDVEAAESSQADGSHGYAVYIKELRKDKMTVIKSKRVILSAGALNTCEILLRCRDEFRCLPFISTSLGKSFSANSGLWPFMVNMEQAGKLNSRQHSKSLVSSEGELRLTARQRLSIHWPHRPSRLRSHLISDGIRSLRQLISAKAWFPMPAWAYHRNISFIPLGGCALSLERDAGVTRAEAENFGKVWNYNNLYIADGALVPTSLGVYPSATIAALAERVAEGITGMEPNVGL